MKIKILIVVVLLFVSCGIKDLKKELSTLKKEYENNKETLLIKDKTIKKLEVTNDVYQKQKEVIGKKIDSVRIEYLITKAIDASNQKKEFDDIYYPLSYEQTMFDEYWKRGKYYTSNSDNECFYNVKATVVNNQVYFYFIGVKLTSKKDIVINVYELDESKNIHIIDSLNSELKVDTIVSSEEFPNIVLAEFISLQIDNLVIKKDKLYYYKLNGYYRAEFGVSADYKQYYEYDIASNEKSKKINKNVLSNVISDGSEFTRIISPDRSKIILDSYMLISFYKVVKEDMSYTDIYFGLDFSYFDMPEESYKEITPIDFPLKFNNKEKIVSKNPETPILIRGLSWHTTKNKVYCNNKTLLPKGLWEFDLDAKKRTKIIPEKKAMHPYFFKVDDKEYIAYVEENKIMLCEPPSNEN